MSLINMQDNIVKSPLVTLLQHRAAELARVQQSTQVPFNQELARQADEMVRQTAEAENEGIREDDDDARRHRREQRKRQRHPKQDTHSSREDESLPEENPEDDDIHHIDITI